ncbi:hypothetical protein H8K90_05840 [Winogradskyella echinorum]|uniref:Bulb-type lectin domain-containing protein n=1 Tax=Winogradskyella echinorum TaxID=538189 RepID=A0ABR6XZH4_9FLAO|nr:hypothetical protein [Winogradskyella echinorum]MBC3845891.1 hypothetical protein [Winogradskyella echinorum]MBC5750239.1 hypothetical protein [Winogradskyella echinorum]
MLFKASRYIIFFLLLLNCNSSDDSSPIDNTVTYVKTFGGSKNDSAQSVVATTDGGYAILGFTQSMDGDITDKQNESFDYWVLKFNAEDELQWQKTYGGTADERGSDIIQTQDGGYAILGYSFSSDGDLTENAGLQDYWLAKLDANGNISWQKSFGYQGADSGISVIQTNDQGYLISGILDVTASGGLGNSSRSGESLHAGGDYWVLKLNASGNVEWSRYFGGNFTDTPEGIIQTDDNGFIIAGGSDSDDTDISNNIGSYDFWVIKISALGDLIWEKSYGGDQIDEARAIVKSSDGNFIIAGDTRSDNNDVSNNIGAADLWLIKISPNGNLLWEKTIGGSSFDVSRSIVKTQNNSFLLAGSSRSSDIDVSENKGQNDAWVLEVDANGNLQWETTIGGSNVDFAYGIAQLNDASIIAVGDSTSNDGDIIENKGFTDLLIIKID